jgi:hemerythrin
MEKMQWNDSLSVGVELIDEQHKMLIQRINDVASAIEQGQGENAIVKTLGFLVDYTHFHFSTEEEHMTEHNYPGIEDHIAKHGELKATLSDLEKDFDEEGATKELAQSVNTFLVNWLIHHIKGVDVPFGAFLKEKGIALAGDN